MNKVDDTFQELSVWQLIFLQSKVNGAEYHGEEFFPNNWNWPQDTYFQRRLRSLREAHVRCGNGTEST